MRHKPHADGRCHASNYWTVVQILSSDVDCSHAVSMVLQLALFVRAVEHPSIWLALALMPTAGACSTGVALILQFNHHAKPLGFVCELMPDRAMRPLMNFLVIGGANIVLLSDIAHVANDHGLHALSIQRGNKSRCLLVFDILDLIAQLSQLFVFRSNELLSSAGTLLLPVDLFRKMFQKFVAILPLGS